MPSTILKTHGFPGCDTVVQLGEDRKNTPVTLLQLTDMQIIDAAQRRTPDRLRVDEINAWPPEQFDALCGDHIRSLVAQTEPDMLFLTGDLVYGSFDDAGTSFRWFCDFMESLGLPWAPVFGNHDNETQMGVAWQCELFEACPHCLFRRGNVTGNGNYTVGIAAGDTLLRVLYMTDSNGCGASADPEVERRAGIYPDQLTRIRKSYGQITASQGHPVPGFMAFHIPTVQFREAELAAGYRTQEREFYTIGVGVPARAGEFGSCLETYRPMDIPGFGEMVRDCAIDGVFVGHCHSINTCIRHEGVRWVFGLKTGQYDYHIVGQLGGTTVTLSGADFQVAHVPALVPLAPYPGGAPMFRHLFAANE